MQKSDGGAAALAPQEGWQTIHATMDRARSSMHVAGTDTILLLWGAILSLGLISQYALGAYAPEFVASRGQWIYGLLWIVLATAGMSGSAVIGHRAGGKDAAGAAVRGAGIRVFLFWLAVLAAGFLIPAAAGMRTAESARMIPDVAIGIAALGYVLFGIMHRPAIAAAGGGIAAAHYVPSHLAGDAAPIITAAAILAVVALGAARIRRSGVL